MQLRLVLVHEISNKYVIASNHKSPYRISNIMPWGGHVNATLGLSSASNMRGLLTITVLATLMLSVSKSMVLCGWEQFTKYCKSLPTMTKASSVTTSVLFEFA